MAKRIDEERPNGITDKEILQHATRLNAIEEDLQKILTEASRLRGEKSGVYRLVKSAGGSKEELEAARALVALDDDQRTERMKMLYRYTNVLLVDKQLWTPPSDAAPQGSMFDDETRAAAEAFQDAVEFANGLAAAKTGGSMDDNPHVGGTRMHQRWAAGFKDFEFDAAGPAKVETANTARKPAPKRGTVVPTGPVEVPKPRGRPAKQKALPAPDAIGEPQGTA